MNRYVIYFMLCTIVFTAVALVIFYFNPAYATTANSFIASIPSRIAGVASWVNTNLAAFGIGAGTIGVLGLAGVNTLWKRAKENTENKAKAQLSEMQQQVLDKNQNVLDLKTQVQAKDTLITQLQANNGNVEGLVSQVKALEKQNSKLATERNQLQKQMDELMAKWLPQEQKVK